MTDRRRTEDRQAFNRVYGDRLPTAIGVYSVDHPEDWDKLIAALANYIDLRANIDYEKRFRIFVQVAEYEEESAD